MSEIVHSQRVAELVKLAHYALRQRPATEKAAFVDAAAVGGGGGGGGGGMPMDPSMMGGGGMPMDPSMMMGGGGGGAPPPPAGISREEVQAMIQAAVGAGGAGGAAGAGGPALKPKIDVNVEIMQLKKMIARIVDALGIPIPAAEMTATPDDLMQMANQQQMGGGAAAGGQGAIPPVQPMQPARGAAPGGGGGQQKSGAFEEGVPYDGSGLLRQSDQAATLHHWLQRRVPA